MIFDSKRVSPVDITDEFSIIQSNYLFNFYMKISPGESFI